MKVMMALMTIIGMLIFALINNFFVESQYNLLRLIFPQCNYMQLRLILLHLIVNCLHKINWHQFNLMSAAAFCLFRIIHFSSYANIFSLSKPPLFLLWLEAIQLLIVQGVILIRQWSWPVRVFRLAGPLIKMAIYQKSMNTRHNQAK